MGLVTASPFSLTLLYHVFSIMTIKGVIKVIIITLYLELHYLNNFKLYGTIIELK